MGIPGPSTLLAQARAGDQSSWRALVERYKNLIHSITRTHRLRHADAADVFQITWLRLVEHLDRIEDPNRLGAWLATTARRECVRTLQRSSRQVLVADETGFHGFDEAAEPVEQRLLCQERDALLQSAFDRLPRRCQRLLRMLMRDPSPSYEEIGDLLCMPVGAIGPTRGRCLARLRRNLEECGYQRDG